MATSMSTESVEQLVHRIEALPEDWHQSGSFRPGVLREMIKHLRGIRVYHSAETGTGKSTLLFSHLSQDHKVFTKDDGGHGNSLRAVLTSPLLVKDSVEFIIGPTQKTLPRYEFRNKLQVVLIDGPHAYPFPDLEYYFLYPHLEEGGFLILDDINIPSVYNMYRFLREERMFRLVATLYSTALFRRTEAPTFNPFGDGWQEQRYNEKRFPVMDESIDYPLTDRIRFLIPAPLRRMLKRILKSGTP